MRSASFVPVTRLGFHLFLDDVVFLDDDLFRDEDDLLRGTFAPDRRASDNPIAIACFRLLTVLPERPLFSVPLFRSCIAFLTFWDAFLPYLAMKPPWPGHASRRLHAEDML